MQILDLEKLSNATINTNFFPYCQVDCFIKNNMLANVLQDFPNINIRGSIPAYRLKCGPFFQQLLDELYDIKLRNLIGSMFTADLSNSHTMLTVRGQTNYRDGHIHTDTPSKIITLLLYLNDTWVETTGNLRLLKDGVNLENYFAEITPTAGKLLVFKVTRNCWHGHYPFLGPRRTIQLNYVINQKVVKKEMKKHSRSYTFKKIVRLFNL